ncbi:Testis-expressed protein 44 [Lemmus lemmus]
MTTEPLEEAKSTSRPVYDLPKASVGNEADDNSADSPGESQNLAFLPDDIPLVGIAAAFSEQYVDQVSMQTDTLIGQDEDQAPLQTATSKGQDEDQAPIQTATSIGKGVEIVISMNTPASGDKDENPDAPSQNQENLDENTSLLSQNASVLQVFVGFQNPVWDRLAENNRASRSRTVSPSDSQNQEKTPGILHVPEGQPEIAPKAEVPSASPEDAQPSVAAPNPSTLDTSSPDQEPKGITKSAEQEVEGFKALNPESKDRPPVPTREDLADESRILQTPPPFSSSPGGSPPPSPGSCHMSLGRNLLDPSLYRPDVENDYMRSMTSLLGSGEDSISSLADILVWSDTATGMGLAVGILASGRSSPADILHDEGPSLRTVSSLLGNARSAFSSGLVAGTGSALRSVTHLLESVERRTVEGIRSAVHYLANHFTSRWARTGPNGD